MSYATLMVHVDFDGASDARIRTAASLANRFNAVLIGVAGWAPRTPLTYGGVIVDAELTEGDMQQMGERLDQCRQHFQTVAERPEKTEWRSGLDFPDEILIREARAADLVVVGRDRVSGDWYRSLDPGAVLLRAGRPILVVPGGVDSMRAERVVIGWKETREARRAVQDALPFLHEASRVSIVEVCEHGSEDEVHRHLSDVTRYLERHRIKMGARIVAHAKSAASELVKVAGDEDADLIVAGAYGHSRLGEWIFGGVTRDLLTKSSSVCCLMSH
jgi:nucleotide-binding universal stress UspA family protein